MARDTERANGEVHRLQAQIDELTAQHARWIGYRNDVLAAAPRQQVGVQANHRGQFDPVFEAPAAPPPVEASARDAGALSPSLAPAPLDRSATDFAHDEVDPFVTGAAANGWRPAASMRPAKTLSAAALLGVAGAALIILAGIVFVAASWSTYGPSARMAILIAFAATFAWLAVIATKRDFATVGGALGVVSAAFVGVSVYALTAGPGGPAPFTLAFASLISGLAGIGLARLNIAAVGAAASGAVVFAVEAGAIEAAVRSDTTVLALTMYAILASLGAGVVIATQSMWTTSNQRNIATYGGVGVAFVGAAVAVISPLTAQGHDPFPFSALLASGFACAGIAVWRPLWGAGVLSGLVTLGAVSAASMWSLTVAQLVFTGAVAILVVVVGLERAPTLWRMPGLAGATPGLAMMAIALIPVVTAVLPSALVGADLAGYGGGAQGFEGLGWFGLALLLVSSIPLLTTRWDPPELAEPTWLMTLGAAIFVAGTTSVAVDIASLAASSHAGVGVGLVVAASAQWFSAPLWRGPRVAGVRNAAIVVAAFGGLHGASTVALNKTGSAGTVWGTVAVGLSLAGLALLSARQPKVAGGWSAVAIAGTGAWTWHASGQYGVVLVAVAVAAVLIALVARALPAGYAAPVLAGSAPVYVVGAVGIAVGLIMATVTSFATHPTNMSLPFAWAPVLSACAALVGPVMGELAARGRVAARKRVTQVVSGLGFVALAITALAQVQQSVSTASGVAPLLVDSVSPAFATAVGGVVFAVAATVPWWRPTRWPIGIAVVALATAQGIVALARIAFELVDMWWAVGAVLGAAAALGIAARWVPRVTLAPAVLLSSLTASAALAPHYPEQALAAAAGGAAVVAWGARWTRGRVRTAVLVGGVGVGPAAAGAVCFAAAVAFGSLVGAYDGDGPGWRPWPTLIVAAAAIALLAWRPMRRRAGAVVAIALVVAAGFVPTPIGWIALAAVGLLATESAARWRGPLGLDPLVPLVIGASAIVWSGGDAVTVAITAGAMSVGSIWTAVRVTRDVIVRSIALVLSALTGSISVGIALGAAGVDPRVAATVAAGAALTMPLVAAAVGLDKQRSVTVGLLAAASVVGPVATLDLAFAGLVVVMACSAWFALSTMGVKWARWVALGGLSVATILLAASVGLTTLEAYTAVPAATMVLVGVWWMRREPTIRTYYALAPGLGVALVPSYVALLIRPEVAARPLALVGASLVLAIAGVALRWFAPLLATALTTVVVAGSQLTVAHSLAPAWVNVAIIGAVLFGLALLAERIKAMR